MQIALKRGGAAGPHLPLEEAYKLPAAPSEAENTYDRQWSHKLSQLVLDQAAAQQVAVGNGERFAALRSLLP